MIREIVKGELELLGLGQSKQPLFYNCNYGIRFEIGVGEIYNQDGTVQKKYTDDALNRAMTIFNTVIESPSFLLWEIYPQNEREGVDFKNLFSKKVAPVLPQEEFSQEIYRDNDTINQTQLYWDLKKQKIPIDKLFYEIIRGDLGGSQEFVSSVYIFDVENHAIIYLYDDRGLDVAAHNKKTLIPAYEKLNSWILDYNRDQIDKMFLA